MLLNRVFAWDLGANLVCCCIYFNGCFLGLGLARTENLSYQTTLVPYQTTLVSDQTALVPDQRAKSRCLACEMFGPRVRDSDVAV